MFGLREQFVPKPDKELCLICMFATDNSWCRKNSSGRGLTCCLCLRWFSPSLSLSWGRAPTPSFQLSIVFVFYLIGLLPHYPSLFGRTAARSQEPLPSTPSLVRRASAGAEALTSLPCNVWVDFRQWWGPMLSTLHVGEAGFRRSWGTDLITPHCLSKIPSEPALQS